MRKNSSSVFILSLFILSLSSFNTTQGQSKDFISLGGGVTFPLIEKHFKDNFNAGFNAGGSYGIDFSRYFKLRIGLLHSELSNKTKGDPDFLVTRVGADAILNDVFIYDVGFYPKVGAALYILHFDDESESHFGISVGGGVTYSLNRSKNMFLNFEAGFDYYLNYDGTAKAILPVSLFIIFRI